MTADDDARALLAAPPRPPAEPALLSADGECGPGTYPQGPPMRPAPGPPAEPGAARAIVHAVLAVQVPDPERAASRAASFDDPALVARVPDAGVRAGLLLLAGTAAEPVLDAFLLGEGLPVPVRSLRYGPPETPTRIAGPAAGGDRTARVVNARYAGEHPALLAGPLAHELLGNPPPVGQGEEAVLHALLAMVHMRVLVSVPAVARLGTELSRRCNALAMTLFNSRPPGSWRMAVVAPDGPGTVPGGAPSMQTPDFWSVPFAGGPPRTTPAPPAFRAVLEGLAAPGTPVPGALAFDEATARLLPDALGDGWLRPTERVAVGRALGLLP